MTTYAGLGLAFDGYVRTGDVNAALAAIGNREEGEDASELAAWAYLALLAGALGSAESWAIRALTPENTDASAALAGAVLAALAAYRGDPFVPGFEASLAAAQRSSDRFTQAVVLVLWAEQAAREDTPRAAPLADRAVRLAEQAGDGFLLHWADRSRAVAVLADGDAEGAATLAAGLANLAPNPTETARAHLLAGRAELERGDAATAALALHRSVEGLAAAGCQLELLSALLWLSVADHERAPSHLESARLIRDALGPDRAFDRRWSDRPCLALGLLGGQSITVGAAPVRCKTSHAEKLIFSLALAGPAGLDAQELCERLWPEKDHAKALSSLSTATWDARVGLGTEAWRLTRTDDRFRLAMDDVRIDLDDIEERLERDPTDGPAIAALGSPVLPAWRHEDWVIDVDERRAALAARVSA